MNMAEHPHVAQPKPIRPSFTLTTSSTPSTPSPTTPAEPSQETFLSRTKSVLNLTSSTLFGIYSPDSDPNATPWRDGSQTPAPRHSVDDDRRPPIIGSMAGSIKSERRPPRQHRDSAINILLRYTIRTILLFGFGVAYGTIISHLHDSRKVAPVQVPGIERSWIYLLGWGAVAVLLGGLTPWVDVFWEDVLGIEKDAILYSESTDEAPHGRRRESQKGSQSGLGADWNPVVRSIGAFVGIAFAIRKLPWQSTSQVSLTLALVNPVLWYLVDRSKPGFILSTIVGLSGTAIVFGVNPNIVPSPATSSPRAGDPRAVTYSGAQGLLHQDIISNETIGVATWIASVLFCSSVCFGNVGRKLALGVKERRASIS